MRERDRRTYTGAWVVVTALAASYLVVQESPGFALALVVVAGVGLVGFLRTTHPRGQDKPHLGIFFDDGQAAPDPAAQQPAGPHATPPASPARPPATPAAQPQPAARRLPEPGPRPAPAGTGGAEVIDLRQPRREPNPTMTVREAVAASEEAARRSTEVADELSNHHVRLLRQVQVKLQDYE